MSATVPQKLQAVIGQLIQSTTSRAGSAATASCQHGISSTPAAVSSTAGQSVPTASALSSNTYDQFTQPEPERIDPLVILDKLVARVLDDDLFSWIRDDAGKLSATMVMLHAQAIKYLLRSAPLRAASARRAFIDLYATTTFAGTAGALYDTVGPSDVPYILLTAQLSLSKKDQKAISELTGGAPGPVGAAMKRVFSEIAPGGLDRPTFALACAILRSDLVAVGGRLAYSEMDENATIDGHEVEDNDIARIQERIDLAYGALVDTKPLRSMMDAAVNKVAMERRYHPVRDYFDALPTWDRRPRLKHVVRDLLNAEPTKEDVAKLAPEERRQLPKRIALARRQIKKFFVGGVARTMQPGCKHDSVLILKGEQGKQKSSWFRTITPCQRFSDSDMDLQDKDSKLELRKFFVFEWSELSTVRSARDWETVKGFTARQEDTVRPPYARRAVRRLRHCIIVGTTNEQEFLGDPTGSRRFWVIETGAGRIDVAETERQRDQLWAEAKYLYERGYRWWFRGKGDVLREEVNRKHSIQDPWRDLIAEWLRGRLPNEDPWSSSDILTGAVHLDRAKQSRTEALRVGQIMRALGFTPKDCWDAKAQRSFKGWVKAS